MGSLAKKEDTWTDIINDVMPQFNKIAVHHKLVQWQAESQFAIQALQKNKYLAECAPYTVQNAVINVAAVGLTLNPADSYAYLVPEYNKDTQQKECNLRISFKGLIKVATDSGGVSWVKAEIVKQSDTFQFRGISKPPVHEMNPFEDRGVTIGVYCVAKTNTDEYLVDVMSKADIDQCRSCAKTQVVWEQWYDEMAKKAVIKRASKQWPRTNKSSRLHEVVQIINETEGGDPNYLIFTPEQQQEFNSFIENKDGFGLYSFGLKLGIRSEPNAASDILAALIKASKDSVMAEKGMTQRGKDIDELHNEGKVIYFEYREEIIDRAKDGDLHAVQEQFDILEEHGLKEIMKDGFDEEEKELLRSLKEKHEIIERKT